MPTARIMNIDCSELLGSVPNNSLVSMRGKDGTVSGTPRRNTLHGVGNGPASVCGCLNLNGCLSCGGHSKLTLS